MRAEALSYLMVFVLSPVLINGQTEVTSLKIVLYSVCQPISSNLKQETFITQIRDLVIGGGASFTEVKLFRQKANLKWKHVASKYKILLCFHVSIDETDVLILT